MFDTLEMVELAADLTPDALQEVLAELGDRVAPTSLARERTLPVHSALHPLFPDGGLVRGRVYAGEGSGATTVALAMARDAVLAGAWMALVDVPTLGVDAAHELGVALERIVRVDTGADGDDEAAGRRWVDVMAAAVDGFDIVVATVPAVYQSSRPPAAIRSLVARLQQRGSVVVLLGAPGSVPVDVSVAAHGTWEGLGQGHGVIGGRRIHARSGGRRQPQSAACSLDLIAAGARLAIEPVAPAAPERELRLVAG